MKKVFVLLFIFTFSIVSQATEKGRDGGCYRKECAVFALVNKNEQTLKLYLFGELSQIMKVSTGRKESETPDFDKRPSGEMRESFRSHKYPGGEYKGLGNMPYSVAITQYKDDTGTNRIVYSIFGTGQNNWKRLGTKASQGSIRLHPESAKYFYSLVKQYGISNTWITVE